MTPRRLLLAFLLALAGLRLLAIGCFELSPDEAYYHLWSQHPDLSYYSKGPGIAATIWAGTHLFGPTEFGVRFFSPLLSLGTSMILFALARRLYGEAVAIWATLALTCVPIYQAGGLLMTIDPLSMFFWMAALYTFWRALERSPEGSSWWPATGAMIGLGFLCKWINAMQLLSIAGFLLLTPKYRREWQRRSIWLLLAAFVPFAIPPLWWNARHEWITLSHLSARGGLEKSFQISPTEFLQFLGQHFGVYSPLIFAGMLAAIWLGWGRARAHLKPRFLLAFALPVLGLYALLALREAGEANWTAPATLSLGLLAVALFYELARERRWVRLWGMGSLALGWVLALVFLGSDALRGIGLPIPYHLDPSSRLRGSKTCAGVVEQARAELEQQLGHSVFLIGNSYQTASALAFYLHDPRVEGPGHPPVYIPESQALENEFSFWPRYDEMEELGDLARHYLAEPPSDPALHHRVQQALEAIPKDERAHPVHTADTRRALVHELHLAMPKLPLDESFVEEQGISLFVGRDALYVTDRAEEHPPSTIKSGFERVEMIGCFDVRRRSLPLRQLRIFACYNYHGLSL